MFHNFFLNPSLIIHFRIHVFLFFILFWGLDKKNRITFFEPFNNPILVKMSSIFLQGSVSLQDWSKWNVCIFCCMANAHFWLYHSPVMAMALMADWIQAPPSIQPSDKVDWQADAVGVRSPGGPARQGDQQLVSLKGSLCKYLQIRVKSIPICS